MDHLHLNSQEHDQGLPPQLPFSRAMRFAFSMGLAVGIFLRLAADSFEVFCVALIVAYAIAMIATAVLCAFVEDGFGWIGVAHAAGVALAFTVSNIIAHTAMHGFDQKLLDAPVSLFLMFGIMLIPAALTAYVSRILKRSGEEGSEPF